MTQLYPTRAAPAESTWPTTLSGPGTADLAALADLIGRPTLRTADLTEPNQPSTVDAAGGVRPGASLGGLPGGSPVRDTPSEPPPAHALSAHVNAAVRPTRDRAD